MPSGKAHLRSLVLATHNAGKVAELRLTLAPVWNGPIHGAGELQLSPPHELSAAEGGTFALNASRKAEAVCAATGHWALADDSGLCVEALGGAPGVDTATYGGWRKVIDILQKSTNRTAHFTSVIALARPNHPTQLFQGIVQGQINHEPQGNQGFGYDPIFIPDTGDGRTFAEMSPAEKNALSHRGLAMSQLLDWLHENAK